MKPNVIIINPDQMRADAVHHLGNEAAYTPHLDALAEEGVSFAHAACQNPVCVPSRCSFLTGLYPHTRRHRTMSYLLQPNEENLFSDMKKAGYYTVSSTRGDFMAGQFPEYHRRLIDQYLMVKRTKTKLPTMRDKHRPHRAYTVCEGGRLPEETHCSEFSAESFSKNDLYAPRQSIQGKSTGEHTKAAMIRTTQYKYVRRLQEEDEFYILAEGENTNHIHDPSCAKEIAAHKEAMLDWYMLTCDLVPKSPDDRFPFEFLENNMTAMGIPKAASKAIKLWLRLKGESAGQFADKMRRKAGH